MNWLVNAWDWFVGVIHRLMVAANDAKVVRGRQAYDPRDVYTPRPFPDANWDSTTHDLQRTRRAQLRAEIQRLRKNKKRSSHLQAELDAMQ